MAKQWPGRGSTPWDGRLKQYVDAVEVEAAEAGRAAAVEAVANDPDVVQEAAEAAAALAQTDAGLLRSTPNEEAFWSFTDKDKRRTWLEILLSTAGPTDYAAGLIWNSISSRVLPRLWPSVTGQPITCIGDSQTAGGSGYGTLLSAKIGGTGVYVEAMGGHGPDEIAARQGGRPACTTASLTIPAAVSPVAISLDVDVLWRTVDTPGTTVRSFVILGIPGTLTRNNTNATYTFTRDTAGSAVWVSRGTAVRTATAEPQRGSIPILLMGRNGIHWETGTGQGRPWTPAKIVSRAQQIMDYSHNSGGRALVLELYPSQNDTTTDRKARLAEYNGLLREAFPNFFIPTTDYLLNRAMTDKGLTPTAQDTADIAAGVPPTSLMADATHLNAIGNDALAGLVANELITRGWV